MLRYCVLLDARGCCLACAFVNARDGVDVVTQFGGLCIRSGVVAYDTPMPLQIDCAPVTDGQCPVPAVGRLLTDAEIVQLCQFFTARAGAGTLNEMGESSDAQNNGIETSARQPHKRWRRSAGVVVH